MNRITALCDACVKGLVRRADRRVADSVAVAVAVDIRQPAHVLAAAIRAVAEVILTFNLKDFPTDTLATYGIEAWHPDDFVTHLLEREPTFVCGAVRRHRKGLKHPPKSVEEYLSTLERQGLTHAVAQLRRFADLV